MKLLLTTALLAMPAVATAEGAPRTPALRSHVPVTATGLPAELDLRIDRWARRTMQLLHEGRPEVARLLAERMVEAAPADPRTHLVQARVLRESVSDQNHVRESLKPQLASIHLVLERCIDLADEILEHDPHSRHGLLYRGWGKMFKAQLHALAFERWSAGRTAKSGKEDLDELLRLDPEQGDALMVLGTYKYFAATLPAFAKVASWLLRIPGGDRGEGLAILEHAGETHAYSRDDARGIRGLALFGFEGAFEEARPVFEDLLRDYPTNPRFVEPLALLDLFDPARLGRDLPRLEARMRAAEASPDPQIRNAGERIRLYVALTQLFLARPEDARANLEILHAAAPTEPDWFPTDIWRFLADVRLMLGDADAAIALYRELAPEERPDHEAIEPRLRFLQESDPASLASSPEEVRTLGLLTPIAAALYEGRLDDAEIALRDLGADDHPAAVFYRGELHFLQRRDAMAIRTFGELGEEDLPERWHLWQYFARLRLAEAHARTGDPERAEDVLDGALASHPTKDLLRHVTLGRKRWFGRWKERTPES